MATDCNYLPLHKPGGITRAGDLHNHKELLPFSINIAWLASRRVVTLGTETVSQSNNVK